MPIRSNPTTVIADHGADLSEHWQTIEKVTAAVAAFAVGTRVFLIAGVTVGLAVAVALFPLWILHLRIFRGAILLMAVGVVTVVSGYLLSRFSAVEHVVVGGLRLRSMTLLASLLCAVGIILWARTRVKATSLDLCYGLGATASALTSPA